MVGWVIRVEVSNLWWSVMVGLFGVMGLGDEVGAV